MLRFDFTGLGESEGDFADTDFSSNVQDLVDAAAYLKTAHQAPKILVGHSLGGTAMLAAAPYIGSAVAVATIGTFVAFVFAYVQVRVPAPRPVKLLIHVMALLPIVSPPFALAVATIFLFGRSGMITKDIFGVRLDIYSWPDVQLDLGVAGLPGIQLPPLGLTLIMG